MKLMHIRNDFQNRIKRGLPFRKPSLRSAYANKRKISAKTAGSPCFTIIDLFEVKPPKMAAMTTQITKNN